jgi:hypothetical protein
MVVKMLQALFYHIGLAFTGRHDGTGLPSSLKSPVFLLLAVISLVALLLRSAIWSDPRYEWWELIIANLAVIAIICAYVREEVSVQAIACFLLFLIAHEALFILIGWLPREILSGIDVVMAIMLALNIAEIDGE